MTERRQGEPDRGDGQKGAAAISAVELNRAQEGDETELCRDVGDV